MPSSQFRTPRLEVPRLGNLPVSPAPSPSRALASPPPMVRSRPEYASPAVEIVTSHVETLIERVTGVDKAIPDNDGDYPVRFRDALYWVRITGSDEQPLVRVFSQVLSDLVPSAELFEAINQINSQLGFCRCFFLEGRVVIETEHLGLTLRTDDFRELAQNVAAASDCFGLTLNERFGGNRPFGDENPEGEFTAPPRCPTGLYL